MFLFLAIMGRGNNVIILLSGAGGAPPPYFGQNRGSGQSDFLKCKTGAPPPPPEGAEKMDNGAPPSFFFLNSWIHPGYLKRNISENLKWVIWAPPLVGLCSSIFEIVLVLELCASFEMVCNGP